MSHPNPKFNKRTPPTTPAAPACRVVDRIDEAVIATMTPAELAGFNAAVRLIAHLLINVEPLPAGSPPTARPTTHYRTTNRPNYPQPTA